MRGSTKAASAALARIEQGNRLIANATKMLATIVDAPSGKRVADLARAAKVYAIRQRLGRAAVNAAHAVEVQAKTEMGRCLADAPKNAGAKGIGPPIAVRGGDRNAPATLADLGISKRESSEAQALAKQVDANPAAHALVVANLVDVATAAKIARHTRDEQREIVEAIQKGAKPSAVIHAVDRETRVASIVEAVGIPDGKFLVVAADPPWAYDNSGLAQSADDHYDTLPADEIARRWRDDVERISTPRSVLFLWATSPLLPEALLVMREWGYTYTASLVWTKDRAPGIGWWAATKHELLLIGRRAETPHPATKIDSVIHAPVGVHSAKPEVFYDAIESMYPLGRERSVHLELFSRRERAGWTRGLYNQDRAA